MHGQSKGTVRQKLTAGSSSCCCTSTQLRMPNHVQFNDEDALTHGQAAERDAVPASGDGMNCPALRKCWTSSADWHEERRVAKPPFTSGAWALTHDQAAERDAVPASGDGKRVPALGRYWIFHGLAWRETTQNYCFWTFSIVHYSRWWK